MCSWQLFRFTLEYLQKLQPRILHFVSWTIHDMCADGLVSCLPVLLHTLIDVFYFLTVGFEGCSPGTYTTSTSVTDIPKCNAYTYSFRLFCIYAQFNTLYVVLVLCIFFSCFHNLRCAYAGHFCPPGKFSSDSGTACKNTVSDQMLMVYLFHNENC